MKIMIVLVLLRLAVSLRRAWLIRRAWRPTWLSSISPSISAGRERGDGVDDDHVDRPERTSMSAISSACSRCRAGRSAAGRCRRTRWARAYTGIHRVLGVDVGADAPVALRLATTVHGERRLARRLRPEICGDVASRQSADAEGEIERQRRRGMESMFIDSSRRCASSSAFLRTAFDLASAISSAFSRFRPSRLRSSCAICCLPFATPVVDFARSSLDRGVGRGCRLM